MPSYLERMRLKEEEQRRNHEEFAKRQRDIEAEMAWQDAEEQFQQRCLEGNPYHVTIAALYAAGELTKGHEVTFFAPWPEDKNGVRARPVTGLVVEDRQTGEGRIGFGGHLYNAPGAFARAALHHAFASHTFAQEYQPVYEQLLINGWRDVVYHKLPLLKYRERADLRRLKEINGARTRYCCHGSRWRRAVQPARPKPAHIFVAPSVAAAAASAALAAAAEAHSTADAAIAFAAKAAARAAKAAARAAKAAVWAAFEADDSVEATEEAIADAIEMFDWHPPEEAEDEDSAQESDDDSDSRASDELDSDDLDSDELDDSDGEESQGTGGEQGSESDAGENTGAKGDRDAATGDANDGQGGSGDEGEGEGDEDADIERIDSYFWNPGTGAVDDVQPACFRTEAPSTAAARLADEMLDATGQRKAELHTELEEAEATAASDGWREWSGQSACTWVEAHVRQTPMDGGTATALVRTRLAEKHIERHKTDGTYIAPAEVPIIGLPPGDPLLQAPWHLELQRRQRDKGGW
eukprot:g2369.t1